MNRFEKWSIWITAAVATLTGLGLLWTKYFMHSDDPWAVINHPLQPWLLKAHIVASPLLIFAIGMVSIRHIWHHYRAKIGHARRSGLLTAAFTLPMILSGYLIQAVTHTVWLQALALAHIIAGVIFAAGLLLHQAAVRSGGERRRAADGAGPRRADRVVPHSAEGERLVGDPEIFAGRG